MCDYSLMAIPNRLAVEGEELVSHRFPTGSMGLASCAEIQRCDNESREALRQAGLWRRIRAFFSVPAVERVSAVCIPPGARLRLHHVPSEVRRLTACAENEDVTFVQTSAEAHTYRDSLRFPNGRLVRLQDLPSGLRIRVLSLEGAEPRAPEFESAGLLTR